MAQCRLMAKDSDYKHLGLTKGPVELWEDGKRDDDRGGVVEWWYFDTLKVKQELDGRYIYKQMPFFLCGIFKGTKPKYGRYLAEGTVTYSDSEQTFTETSDLIYGFAFVGEEYKQYMERSM